MPESQRYPIPKYRFRNEITVERSRFIATVQPVESEDEAHEFIAEMKREFADANHNCWAFLVGQPGSSDRIGLSDDGEPHGVAGKPILTALQHSGLGDTVVVVTRYFGGIKLGKGGMVKAYTAAVKNALELLPRGEYVDKVTVEAAIVYANVTPFQRRLDDFEVEILEVEYGEKVVYRLLLPREHLERFEVMYRDLTLGQGALLEI